MAPFEPLDTHDALQRHPHHDVLAHEVLAREVWDDAVWDDAACRGQTHLFFPPRAERPQARFRREAQARLLCGKCPVQPQCRHFARANREYGMWGGESEEERHRAGFTVAAPIGVRARAAS